MTKIERLKLRFASGMSEGRISSDEWELEFLPMLEDAERYRFIREDDGVLVLSGMSGPSDFDAVIDAERTPTKEQQ